MNETLQTALMPGLTLLVALMVHATLRAFHDAYAFVRHGVLAWQGRKVLGELQAEVDQGRRTSFELFFQHGIHHLQLQDAHRARSFFEAATVAHPLSAQGYYGQGLAWRESLYFPGHLQEQVLLQALERDGRHDEARLLLIEFYVQAGLYERARSAYRELPDELRALLLDEVLSKDDSASLEAGEVAWPRLGHRERRFLVILDTLCVGLFAVSFWVRPLFTLALYLVALLLPQHLLYWWELRTSTRGFSVGNLLGRRRFEWADLRDLVELPGGGFFLQLRDRSLFISRNWDRYGALLTSLKHHLYEVGWSPRLEQYRRGRWARPIIG